MIDKEILDAVLPLPTLDELKEQKVEELKDEGFVISNFHSGGVFYTMLMIVLRIKVDNRYSRFCRAAACEEILTHF